MSSSLCFICVYVLSTSGSELLGGLRWVALFGGLQRASERRRRQRASEHRRRQRSSERRRRQRVKIWAEAEKKLEDFLPMLLLSGYSLRIILDFLLTLKYERTLPLGN